MNEGEMSPNETQSWLVRNGPAYQQIHENIRAKDEISFKLMSLVPLISGGGISLLVKSGTPWGLKCFVSALAAVVVFGIFRWELRNIQWCSWLLIQAGEMGDKRP